MELALEVSWRAGWWDQQCAIPRRVEAGWEEQSRSTGGGAGVS